MGKAPPRRQSSPPGSMGTKTSRGSTLGWFCACSFLLLFLEVATRSHDYMNNVIAMLGNSETHVDATRTSEGRTAQQQYDVCIVGAGLSGAVLAERHASVFQHSVLVVEKRDHIGGNCYDYVDEETGIRMNKYGIHLFHTKEDRVWNYAQRFSQWTTWEHQIVAKVNDLYVPFPVNINTVNDLFNMSIASGEDMSAWLASVQVEPVFGKAVNSEEAAMQNVGRDLYELILKPYAVKLWNKEPKDLGPAILAGIPLRPSKDNRAFADKFQALPTNGYTRIFKNMFNFPSITLKLNTDYFDVRKNIQCGHTYFTGPIDAYYAAQGMPKLEYRSIEFEKRIFRDMKYYQPKAQVNYPTMEYNYTRAIEYKHILHQESPHTVVVFERNTNQGEPFYPVPTNANRELYSKYYGLAKQETNVTFVRRFANRANLNMDETILNALKSFDAYGNVTCSVVIAHYREDLTWLNELSHDCEVYVYHNGGWTAERVQDPIKAPLKITLLNNFGREARAFLHHIVSRYENLTNKVMFLQGHPHAMESTKSLQQSISDMLLSDIDFQGVYPPEALFYKDAPLSVRKQDNYHTRYDGALADNFRGTIEHIWADNKPDEFLFFPGAQCFVSRDRIQFHPKFVYEELLRLLTNTREELYNPWIYERLWVTILDGTHKTRIETNVSENENQTSIAK